MSKRKSLRDKLTQEFVFGSEVDETPVAKDKKEQLESTLKVPLTDIHLSNKQPRHYFDPIKLKELTQSIKEHGILEPLLVRPLGDSEYELVAGERRYRAAQAAKLTKAPIVIRELDDKEALEIALIENLQREDLNPVEETEGILTLLTMELSSTRQEVIALLNRAAHVKKKGIQVTDNVVRNQLDMIEKLFVKVGRLTSESFRTHRLPLLNLPLEILEALRKGQIAYTKAKAIARVAPEQQRKELLQEAIEKNLSLSEIKKRVTGLQVIEQTKSPDNSLKNRMKNLSRCINKSKIWDDPKKQEVLEKAITTIEKLLAEEG